MLNSTRPFRGASIAAMSNTSERVMWRGAARGCTVIPGEPASRHTCTASVTDGTRPPRELRTVATLFTLTDSLITRVNSQLPTLAHPQAVRLGGVELGVHTVAPRCCFTASTIS